MNLYLKPNAIFLTLFLLNRNVDYTFEAIFEYIYHTLCIYKWSELKRTCGRICHWRVHTLLLSS